MKTEYEKAVACEMFDAYCKQILRNALTDFLRKRRHLAEREIPTADMDIYIGNEDEIDKRSWEELLYIKFEGKSYPMENEPLQKALSTLSEQHLGVLLLKYWHRMNDLEIASHFQIGERTVRYWRKSAISKIQRWYLGNKVKLDYPSR